MKLTAQKLYSGCGVSDVLDVWTPQNTQNWDRYSFLYRFFSHRQPPDEDAATIQLMLFWELGGSYRK